MCLSEWNYSECILEQSEDWATDDKTCSRQPHAAPFGKCKVILPKTCKQTLIVPPVKRYLHNNFIPLRVKDGGLNPKFKCILTFSQSHHDASIGWVISNNLDIFKSMFCSVLPSPYYGSAREHIRIDRKRDFLH